MTTVDGATLDDEALATADTITVVDAASVTAADADTFGDKLSGDAGTLAVSGYTNQNLADIATATVNVTTVDGATLDDEALATADTITVVDAASVSAADADTFGDKLLGDAGTLAVSGYTNQNLADIATATVNVTTVDGATLVGTALTTADTITVVDAASVSAADADTFGDKLLGAGTLTVTGYSTQNLADIATATVNVSLSDADKTISNALLSTADQITVSAGRTLTVDSDATLTDLDSIVLNGTNASLSTDEAGWLDLSGVTSINGTSANGESVVITTSGSGAKAVNLKQVDDATGVDSFTVDADTNNSTLHVRLSETLALSGVVDITLDSTTGANRDYVLVESNLTGASTGETVYDSTTTWAELGLSGATVSNFVPNKDSFGVVDSSGEFIFNSLQVGVPVGATSGVFTTDGKLYLDINATINLDSVADVRSYVAQNIADTNTNVDVGFALINFDENDNLDMGLFHVKWTGSNGADPEANSADLQVSKLATLQNVDADAALSLTNAIAARNFVAKAYPTGLE